MSKGADYDYHIARARAEMDRAYRAAGSTAAAAHMKLSALHMQSARAASTAHREDIAAPDARARPTSGTPAADRVAG